MSKKIGRFTMTRLSERSYTTRFLARQPSDSMSGLDRVEGSTARLTRTIMIGFWNSAHHYSHNSGRSKAVRTLTLTVSAVASVALYGSHSSVVSAEDAPSLSETSLQTDSSSQASDRESRLRDIEDQLLKQLSMGATPSAQENTPTPLPNVKHVASSEPALAPASPTPTQPKRQAPAPIKTAAPSIVHRPKIMKAALPEPSTIDQVQVPESRNPAPATIVPVTAQSSPHRTPKMKRSAPSEQISAKDLEHRLAISESQLALLTKELETTKAKLAQSESRASDLTQKLEDGTSTRTSESVEQASSGVQQVSAQGTDITDSLDRRADAYTTVARVTKDNAPLRIGPGTRESTILRVSRNSVVTIEHRTGDWYRVIMTDGTRGWIIGSSLLFNEGLRPGSTVRVGAFETRLETMGLEY